MSIKNRISQPETFEELGRQLVRLLPFAEITAAEIAGLTRDANSPGTRFDILANKNGKALTVILSGGESNAVGGWTVDAGRTLTTDEGRVVREFAQVFNDDVANAPRWGRDEELWLSLQQTRLSRVIARLSSFHTPIFVRWLRTFENALGLRYERQPFATHLVLTKQTKWVKDNAAVSYITFPERMSLSKALFEEKWTRAITSSGEIALVGQGHDRGVSGILAIQGPTRRQSKLFAPHTSLTNLSSALVPGTMAFLASAEGDLRVLFPNGMTFTKAQGAWTMANLPLLERVLADELDAEVASALTRIVADLSYEGHGALFCCLSSDRSIVDIVPDVHEDSRANLNLRAMSQKLSITKSAHQGVIKRFATVDGAVVIGPRGRVLDTACMISDPAEALLQELKITKRQRFPAHGALLHGTRACTGWRSKSQRMVQ